MTTLDYILDELPDRLVKFVFPSTVVAAFWAQAAAESSRYPVAVERFIAWDTFKMQTLSADQQNGHKANRAVRILFASNFLASNAQTPVLHEYITPAYSGDYSPFVSPLAELLPSLYGILLRADEQNITNDSYFSDLTIIKDHYMQFLEENHVFEPSWNRNPFHTKNNRYLLFFSELCEDWDEYCDELSEIKTVKIIPLNTIEPPAVHKNANQIRHILGELSECFVHFSFSGEEYRWLALIIRRLLDEAGLEYKDISISIPGEKNPQRLIQELCLHDIPVALNQRKPLTEHPGGRIFASMAACQGKKWSYQSLKNLLLDNAFPWKDKQLINAFMEAGIRYRCVSNFTENRRELDVWDRSLWKESPLHFAGYSIAEIRAFYLQLKKNIQIVLSAKKFTNLRKYWYLFQETYFDEYAMNKETAEIITEIMSKLNELIEMEEQFSTTFNENNENNEKINAPIFPIFQAYIQEESGSHQSSKQAISLYGYKVAAGIGTPVHFIINMNQNDATVLYTGGATFLREDRKNLLNIQNRDVSTEFIYAYQVSAAFPVFTVSDRTFSGVVIPHRKLYDRLTELRDIRFPANRYDVEVFLATQRQSVPGIGPSTIQKKGWDAYTVLQTLPLPVDFRTEPIPDANLRTTIQEHLGQQKQFRDRAYNKNYEPNREKNESLTISPTDLNEYNDCPFKWVLRRGLGIQEKQTEIETINQKDLGTLYHAILESLFKTIKDNDSRFRAEDLPVYINNYLPQEITKALIEAEHKEGFFQKSIYAMLEQRIVSALSYYLEADKQTLNGAEVTGSEYALRKTYTDSETALTGVADLVMYNEDATYTIIDFKTGVIPGRKDIRINDNDDFPRNVQIAAYIAMLEQTSDARVSTAQFYSIDRRKFHKAVAEKNEDDKISRSAYDKEVVSVDMIFSRVTTAIKHGDYTVPASHNRKECASCTLASVCRMSF
jgi:RecB family exonuclease